MEEELIQVTEPDDAPQAEVQSVQEPSQAAPEPSDEKKRVFYSPVAQYSFAATIRQMQVAGVSAKEKLSWLVRDASLCDPRIPDLTSAHTAPDTYEGDRVLIETERIAVVANGDDLVYYTKFGRGLALAELAFFGDVPYDKMSDCVREVISRDDVMDARLKYGRGGNWFDIQESLGERPSLGAMEAAAHRADRSLSDLTARSEGLVSRISDRAFRRLNALVPESWRIPDISRDSGLRFEDRQAVEEQWAKDHPETAEKPVPAVRSASWLAEAPEREVAAEIKVRMGSDPLFRQVYEELMTLRSALARKDSGSPGNIFEWAQQSIEYRHKARAGRKAGRRSGKEQSEQSGQEAQVSRGAKMHR